MNQKDNNIIIKVETAGLDDALSKARELIELLQAAKQLACALAVTTNDTNLEFEIES